MKIKSQRHEMQPSKKQFYNKLFETSLLLLTEITFGNYLLTL